MKELRIQGDDKDMEMFINLAERLGLSYSVDTVMVSTTVSSWNTITTDEGRALKYENLKNIYGRVFYDFGIKDNEVNKKEFYLAVEKQNKIEIVKFIRNNSASFIGLRGAKAYTEDILGL